MAKRGRQKDGRPSSNAAQNAQVADAAVSAGLTPEQRRRLGRIVEEESRGFGADLGYQDILEIARDLKAGKL